MSTIRLGLRVGRWGVLGFGALAFVTTAVQALAFYQVAGHTAAERATFAQSVAVLASHFTVVLPPPTRPDTVGGFVQYRGYGGLAILFAVWALAAAAGAARGDEERGVVEAVLATGVTRASLLAARAAAFAIGALAAAAAAGAGLEVGAASGGESIPVSSVLEAAAALAALALCCYCLTLLVAQLTAARLTAAVAGIVLLVLFLVNSLSRNLAWLVSVRWLSPFRYYELSRPLAPGGPFEVWATAVLLTAAALACAAAALVFARRDLGSPAVRLSHAVHAAGYEPSRNPWWRIPVARGLYERRAGFFAWMVGMMALGALFVALTRSVVQPLLALPGLERFFTVFIRGELYSSFLGYIWFSTAQLLFAAFAIVQVARWTSDEAEGRLELVLATPRSRALVIVERAAVLAVGATLIALASWLAVAAAAGSQAIDVDRGRLIQASLLLVPFTLFFAGLGSLLAAWIPRAAVGLLGGIAFASYLADQVGALFKWPSWVQDLSAFRLFGTPLSDGIDRQGLALMVLIAIVGFGSSILAMERRDVGS
ncbi:MAG TPA: ABC transporter permease subunit [Candidatus Dormibacteraeota bacterium]